MEVLYSVSLVRINPASLAILIYQSHLRAAACRYTPAKETFHLRPSRGSLAASERCSGIRSLVMQVGQYINNELKTDGAHKNDLPDPNIICLDTN